MDKFHGFDGLFLREQRLLELSEDKFTFLINMHISTEMEGFEFFASLDKFINRSRSNCNLPSLSLKIQGQ